MIASRSTVDQLLQLAKSCRIFLSMPCVEGLTPRFMNMSGTAAADVEPVGDASGPGVRRHGIFSPDEAGVSLFDHGLLYGDSLFEGLLVTGGRIFTWREHLARLQRGARRLYITIPYSAVDLTLQISKTILAAGLESAERGYVRLVVTRGLGDLGLHPEKCLGSTVYALAARFQLYPEELYERGIEVALAHRVRRPGVDVLDPNIKSSNYLNNIRGILESLGQGLPETLMLTQRGYVAEGIADNLFLVSGDPMTRDPSRVLLRTPGPDVCLEGITRALVLKAGARLGYAVDDDAKLLPSDLVGLDREVFLTGTAAGLIPVIAVDGRQVGDGRPGPVARRLRQCLHEAMADPTMGIAVTAGRQEIEDYLLAAPSPATQAADAAPARL